MRNAGLEETQAGIKIARRNINNLRYADDMGDPGSIPGSGRPPGEGNGNPPQYSFLENPMDTGTWQVHRVAKSQT